jgi:hypothetical protein
LSQILSFIINCNVNKWMCNCIKMWSQKFT